MNQQLLDDAQTRAKILPRVEGEATLPQNVTSDDFGSRTGTPDSAATGSPAPSPTTTTTPPPVPPIINLNGEVVVQNRRNRLYSNGNQGRAIDKEQLEAIKTTLLSTNEVTFKLANGYGGTGTSETDSIASTRADSEKSNSKIPDGGYGWVVVMSSVIVSLIADGVSFSFGLLFTEWLKYFQESKSKTSWIGSLFLAVPLVSGPIMSNLVDRYGCRKCTMLGGLISGLGFFMASFCTSIEGLYITFGLIGGLGLGFAYVTAVVSIAFWFEKKRNLAIGIGASGTGLGTFLYAPFTQWLIENYGWRSTTLILAGTMLNLCVCGALMRDPDWMIEESRLESRSQSVATFSNSSICLDEIKKLLDAGTATGDVLDKLVTNFNTEANQQIAVPEIVQAERKYKSEMCLPHFKDSRLDVAAIDTTINHSRRSLRRKKDEVALSPQDLFGPITRKNVVVRSHDRHLASAETMNKSDYEDYLRYRDDEDRYYDEDNDSIGAMSLDSMNDHSHRWSGSKMLGSSRLSLDENMILRSTHDVDIEEEMKKSFRGNSLDVVYETDFLGEHGGNLVPYHDGGLRVVAVKGPSVDVDKHRTMGFNPRLPIGPNQQPRKRILTRNSNYFKNMRIHRHSITYRSAILNTHRYRMKASSCPNIYRNSMTTLARESEEKWYDDFLDLLKSIFDFTLYLDPKFAVINCSILLLFIWFIVPYFYITEHLMRYNFAEKDGAFIISLIGVFNTIGMIVFGWLGDRPWVNVTKTYAGNMVVCGLSVGLIPVAGDNFMMLCGLSVVFGVTFASSFSFTPTILAQIVDLEDFTCAYGLILLTQGIGNLVGPPIAGIMFDISQTWDLAFYAAGFFILISGFLAYITAILEDREEAATKEKERDAEQMSMRHD